MKIVKMFKTAIQQALSMFVVRNRVYWVFRKFKRLETIDTAPETWLIDVDFAIRFVEPLKAEKKLKKQLILQNSYNLGKSLSSYMVANGCKYQK